MESHAKSWSLFVLRLIVGLALLTWPRVGIAAGTWSVIATGGKSLGQVDFPATIAVDTAGNLYVADGQEPNFRLQRRDAQGNWSVIATYGAAIGQISSRGAALTADSVDNLYVAEDSRIPRQITELQG